MLQKKRSEDLLDQATRNLEKEVAEKTAELREANARLHEELRRRQEAQARLSESERRYRELYEGRQRLRPAHGLFHRQET